MNDVRRLLIAQTVIVLITGCAASSGPDLGLVADNKLHPCPSSPNCVSSDDSGGSHGIAPLAVRASPETAWRTLISHIEAEPGYTITDHDTGYLRAEARTRVLRFVDDVEFHLRGTERQIAMRSASRVGYSDLGTNRRRLESVREALAGTGVVERSE